MTSNKPSGEIPPMFLGRSRTEWWIDDVEMWSSLAIYLVVWVGFLSAGFQSGLLLPALAWSCVYVGMHVYEIKVRGHCYLSADFTVFPVVCIVSLIVCGSDARQAGPFFLRGLCGFFLAHVAALIYFALLKGIMYRCLRERIEAERATA